MTKSVLIVFISTVLLIHTLVNLYIFIRGWQSISGFPFLKKGYVVIYIFFFLSYIIARILEQYNCGTVTTVFTWIGSFWLGAMLYFLIAVVLIDLIRVIHYFIPFLPTASASYHKFKLITAITVSSIVLIVLIFGFINAYHPYINKINLSINKKASAHKQLRIAAVSDIHLGYIISKKQFTRYVAQINALKPDIILMAGDIFDEDPHPVIKKNIGELFLQLKAPLGVYAITGNHEYIGGGNAACNYMNEHGIKVLRDTSVLIDNSFYLVGREDRDKSRFSGTQRKELEELLQPIDASLPIIVLDHQPFTLAKHAALNIDLQISGHTHYGQVWPFNYIVDAIFELGAGYKKINNSHFIVSTGLGNWGPPIRLGNRPEILDIQIVFSH